MASAGRRAAGAMVRALDSLLGQVTGHSRDDVADPYLLRVGALAWDDLGQAGPVAEPPTDAAKRHRIVRKFYEDFSEPSRVDVGVPIDSVSDPKVFRIKGGDWRAAVRYIPDDGVMWLCRVLALAKFTQEQHAYAEFGRFYDEGVMLPNAEERRVARGDQFIVSAVASLRQARVDADNEPLRWWSADAVRPDGSHHHFGRLYVERELDEGQGEYITRFLLLISSPPSDVEVRDGWRELVIAHIFPSEEPVLPAYELPAGTNLRSWEIPYMQQTVELLDEEELDGP